MGMLHAACRNEPCAKECVMSHAGMSIMWQVGSSYVSCRNGLSRTMESIMLHMGCLRLVGSLKLYVSLENIGLFYRALLQKRPIILRSLLAKATPYRTSSSRTMEGILSFAGMRHVARRIG